MEYDNACLIMVHAITLRLLELTGSHPMATHFLAAELRTLGYTPEQSIKILQNAFKQIAQYEDAEAFVQQVLKREEQAENKEEVKES